MLRVCGVAMLAIAVCLRFANLDADIQPQQNADDLGDEGYWFLPARDLLHFGTFDPQSNFFQAQAGAPLTVLTLAALARAAGSIDYTLVRAPSAFYSSLTLALAVFYFDRLKRMPLAALCFVALYGLFPATLLYSRMAHLEQHVLFFFFLSFVILERARSAKGYAAAGATLSIAIAVKLVSLVVVPAFAMCLALRRSRAPAAIVGFTAGAMPILALLAGYLWLNAERFAPTLNTLATYVRAPGSFIDSFSIEYFWSNALVWPYVPWIAAGLASLLLLRSERDEGRTWMLLWVTTAFVVLSLFRYQSYARHMLLLFPLLLLTSLSIGQLHRRFRGHEVQLALSLACGVALAVSVLASTGGIARATLLAPHYTYRDASRVLAAITDETDRIVGVHNYGLSIVARYRPKMTFNARNWRGIDPLSEVKPTGALVATMFNGRAPSGQWDRHFIGREQFPYTEHLERLKYLDRFEVDFYRVFSAAAEYLDFLRFRQGRTSRYDGVIYNMYRDDAVLGCMVKSALVAESRGDSEISHYKISATGCAGMMGFCDATATDTRFANIFTRIVASPLRAANDPDVFERDDRFVPSKALRAGGRYLRDLRRRFLRYTDSVELAFAAYNGGPRFVAFLIEKTGSADPRWETDLLGALRALGSQPAPGYESWTAASRQHKFQTELPRYVADASQTFQACSQRQCFAVAHP